MKGGISFRGVSRYYGEILGVHDVNLEIDSGITSLVGSNGAGKTTLLNLLAGLLRPSRGSIEVCGVSPRDTGAFQRLVGYATQFDTFPRGITGGDYVHFRLRMFGLDRGESRRRAGEVLERVGIGAAASKRVATYSKGMRQRLQLAGALATDPPVLVLDEPLNGLDPVARSQFIREFRRLAEGGRHVVVSSHILEEVDQISDHVIMMSQGNVVAEGQIQAVRSEMRDQPAGLLVVCPQPSLLARRAFESDDVVEARIGEDPPSVRIRTRDVEGFYAFLNRIVLEEGLAVEQVSRTDEDAFSVYGYLVGEEPR